MGLWTGYLANSTGESLSRILGVVTTGSWRTDGTTTNEPPLTIAPDHDVTWTVEEDFLGRSAGSAIYAGPGGSLRIDWDVPLLGGPTYQGSAKGGYEMQRMGSDPPESGGVMYRVTRTPAPPPPPPPPPTPAPVPVAPNASQKISMKVTADLSDGFFKGVIAMCGRLSCSPSDMLSVWLYESGVRAGAHNPNGHASGLCQFMPFNLDRVGWHQKDADGKPDHAGFRALSAEQQLPYVEKYYSFYKGKLSDRVQCYVATFLPAFLSSDQSPDTILCRQDDARRDLRAAYASNTSFDGDKKGYITRGDLAKAIDRAQVSNKKRWDDISARLAAAQ